MHTQNDFQEIVPNELHQGISTRLRVIFCQQTATIRPVCDSLGKDKDLDRACSQSIVVQQLCCSISSTIHCLELVAQDYLSFI